MPLGQGLISSNNLREALGLSLFCPPCPVECGAYSSGVSRKGKNVFLCNLLALLNIVASISERLLSRYLEGLIVCYI